MNQTQELYNLGCSIREKLDKRCFHDAFEPEEIADDRYKRDRIEKEVAEPMRRFLQIWDAMRKGDQ